MKHALLFGLFCVYFLTACKSQDQFESINPIYWNAIEQNAENANEAFKRCLHFVNGWRQYADPETGLIPKNLSRNRDIWNAQDSAADNYPFMVLTTAMTDRVMFDGIMKDILNTEIKLTSRVDRLPDTYSFTKNEFENRSINMDRLIFGGSEYVKDGLLPLTEWLGPSPWADRMIGIVDDIWKHAAYPTKYGLIPSTSNEVNGEMLQVLSRMYWLSGNKKYMEWANRLANHYLIDSPLIAEDKKIRLRDHGCEIIAGLSEIYVLNYYEAPEKAKTYQKPIYQLYDRVLEMARNEHGMLYNWFNPLTGEHDDQICDTWGYNYNGFYTLYLLDGKEEYKEAVLKVMSHLNEHYKNYQWEGKSADGYADAIEGAINLFNREQNPSSANWIDSQIKVMWHIQKPDGIVEGWHGDGNFARTSLMYALWKTQGLWLDPWREDIKIGAIEVDNALYLSIRGTKSWKGKIKFDPARHKEFLNLPIDYPRINQFPEWFTVNSKKDYMVYDNKKTKAKVISGNDLISGLMVSLDGDDERKFIVKLK